MMRQKFAFIFSLITLIGIWSCEEDVPQIEPLQIPSNLQVSANVSTDGSGLVEFTATAENAIAYHYYLGLGPGETPTLSQDGSLVYNYKQSGLFLAQVVAYGSGGVSSSKTIEIEIEVDYEPPANVISILTNNSSRTWVWKQGVTAHMGVGPEYFDDGSVGDAPSWWQAGPNEKASEGCLYDDEITFTLNPDQSVSMTLENYGVTYFHVDEVADALGLPRPAGDQCYDYPAPGTKNVGFFEATSGVPGSTNVGMEINGSFLSYYLGTSTYEILSISPEELHTRTVQDVDGFKLAWYQKFIAAEFDPCVRGDREYEMVWSDEFDADGAPDPSKWAFDIGNGEDGWGNLEEQYYTDRPDNVIVENGSLKITAKFESFGDQDYTSARLKTEGLFDFTYGKVDVRAKLPSAEGTWPAAWLLGSDYKTNTWPACGEIDIMEHTGNNPGVAEAALHSPSSFDDTVNKGAINIDDPFNEWHVYSVEWEDKNIIFYVDGVEFYKYCPETRTQENYPFDSNFFIILNLAMGGKKGGQIDPVFTEDIFEIDYVRVYKQK